MAYHINLVLQHSQQTQCYTKVICFDSPKYFGLKRTNFFKVQDCKIQNSRIEDQKVKNIQDYENQNSRIED